jgi:hypothetical protein
MRYRLVVAGGGSGRRHGGAGRVLVERVSSIIY